MPIKEGIKYAVNEALSNLMSKPIKKEEPKQNWLQRMIMTGAMAENPAVMTASGYRPDKEKGIIQDKVNDEYVKRLRQNLVGIGAAGAGAMAGAGALWKVANNPVVSAGIDVATGNYGDAAVGLAMDIFPWNRVLRKTKTFKVSKNIGDVDPDLIHMTDYIDIENGDIIIKPKERSGRNLITTHYTMGIPVRTHGGGDWSKSKFAIISPFSDVSSNIQPSGIEPMDTFFLGQQRLKKAAVLTDDYKEYERLVSEGINVTLVPKGKVYEYAGIGTVKPTKKFMEDLSRKTGIQISLNPKKVTIDDTQDSDIIFSEKIKGLKEGNPRLDPRHGDYVVLNSPYDSSLKNGAVDYQDFHVFAAPDNHDMHWSSNDISNVYSRLPELPEHERKFVMKYFIKDLKSSSKELMNRIKQGKFGGNARHIELLEINDLINGNEKRDWYRWLEQIKTKQAE